MLRGPDVLKSKAPPNAAPDFKCQEKVGESARRVYSVLAEYVLVSGSDPYAFAMNYQRIATLAGYADKTNARRSVEKAELAGILFRLHHGKPREKGCAGVPVLLCLRGSGESIDDAIEAGKRTPHYQSRINTAALPTPKPLYGALTWSELQECDAEKYEELLCLLGSSHWPVANKDYLGCKIRRTSEFPTPSIQLTPSAQASRDSMLVGEVGDLFRKDRYGRPLDDSTESLELDFELAG